ncbi:MAG TPA: CRTAC1 family protein, partial [Candidatus Latescibacteria bacterium]|nr:CRTAC1 family protein [Candidatus Latescibacterota bacterium]
MLLPLLIACAQDAYFVDATYEARVAFRHVNGAYGEHHFIETMGPGVAFLDYDNDGYLDIYAVNGQYLSDTTAIRATNVLYRNNG